MTGGRERRDSFDSIEMNGLRLHSSLKTKSKQALDSISRVSQTDVCRSFSLSPIYFFNIRYLPWWRTSQEFFWVQHIFHAHSPSLSVAIFRLDFELLTHCKLAELWNRDKFSSFATLHEGTMFQRGYRFSSFGTLHKGTIFQRGYKFSSFGTLHERTIYHRKKKQ